MSHTGRITISEIITPLNPDNLGYESTAAVASAEISCLLSCNKNNEHIEYFYFNWPFVNSA